jgi:hypothetical protein
MRSIFSIVVIVSLALGLQACGGGGSSTTTPDASPSGYYTGSAAVKTPSDDTTDYAIDDIQIMINGNRIMIMSDLKAVLYDGTFTVSGNTLTSTVSIYYNGNIQTGAAATASLVATVTEGSQLTGTFTGTELGNGTFTSTYSNLSNTSANITNVENDNSGGGTRAWKTNPNEATGTNVLQIEVFTNSEMTDAINATGLTFNGCTFNQESLTSYEPIANSSLFSVKIYFRGCTTSDVRSVNSGSYTGFSQYKSDTPNKIALAITNGKYALTDDFDEQ